MKSDMWIYFKNSKLAPISAMAKYAGWVAAMLSIAMSAAFAEDLPVLGKHNPEFDDYIATHPSGNLGKLGSASPSVAADSTIDDGHGRRRGTGLVPTPVDYSHMKGMVPRFLQAGGGGSGAATAAGAKGASGNSGAAVASGGMPFSPVQQLPVTYTSATAFDPRATIMVSPVRDQGQCGSCWAFASFGSLEASTLYSGAGIVEYSENNLLGSTGLPNLNCATGGNSHVATAYLTRWGNTFGYASGPVLETDDPYAAALTPTALSPSMAGLLPRGHVQDVLYLPNRSSATDNLNWKYAVQTYGGLYAEIFADMGSISLATRKPLYYNASNAAYYYYGGNGVNHAVTLVGWDDNYPASNFSTPPAGNGAFLMKNQWGTAFGQGGYFYISYYDTSLQNLAAFLPADPATNYAHQYMYDANGQMMSIGYSSTTGWGANIFTANANEPSLQAVSFYTTSVDTTYVVNIYTNVGVNPTSGTLQAAATVSGTLAWAGFHTVKLPVPVALTAGQIFSVVVRFDAPGNLAPIPIESATSGGLGTGPLTTAPGRSFMSGDGVTWLDVGASPYNYNVNIRALTGLSLSGLPAAQLGMSYGQTITVSDGTAPYSYQITRGTLPAGLSLSVDGIISGTPLENGTQAFTINATDSTPAPLGGPFHGGRDYTITVAGGLTNASAVSIGGDNFTCALSAAGAVSCWGYNANGQLGNGTTANSASPVAVSGLASGISAIGSGLDYSCTLSNAGAVVCWGDNSHGQLGNGTTTASSIPVPVSGLVGGVTAIAVGPYHACAITATQAVMCWGMNTYGELGDGTTTDSLAPVAVPTLSSGVTALALGYLHTCVNTSTNSVQCWGYNGDGELGIGAVNGTTLGTVPSTTPVAVTGLSASAIALKAGAYHTCTILSTGGMQCWGLNSSGQLGDGSTVSAASPVTVAGLSGPVSAIGLGSGHSCALTTADAMQCWGDGISGDLGNGATTPSSAPASVSALAGSVAAIAAGGHNTCAVASNGTLQCWGANAFTQLGNGSSVDSSVPVAVAGFGGGSIQAISFAALPAQIVGGSASMASATASSGLAVSLTSFAPAVCSVNGNSVLPVSAGTCTIAASQSGDNNFGPALQVTQSFLVTGTAAQTITFAALADRTYPSAAFNLGATASSGLAVNFVSATPDVCSINGITVTPLMPGICTIAAHQMGNTTYAAAPQVSQSFVHVVPVTYVFADQSVGTTSAAQTISWTAGPWPLTIGTPTLTANFVITANTCPTVLPGGMSCSISVAFAPTVAGPLTGYLGVNGGYTALSGNGLAPLTAQTITFGVAPTLTVGSSGTLSATASSGLAVTFTSSTPTICSVSGSTVTGLAGGTCSIAADQAGNASVAAAPQVMQSITVPAPLLTAQTITIGATPILTVGSTGTLSATASSGLPVTLTSSTPTICSVSGSTVTGLAVGNCSISADQAGNASYSAAPTMTQTVTVTAALTAQTITFGTAPTLTLGGSGVLSATASSGLALTFTSSTPTICSVSGSTVTGLAVGTCSINADQAGNASYTAAATVTQNIKVKSTIKLAPKSLAFNSQSVGTTGATQTVTLTNSGTTAVTVGTISSSTDFTVLNTTCGASVAAGGSCTISVAFVPTVTGALTGTLTVGTLGTVALTGTGAAAGVVSTGTGLSLGAGSYAYGAVTSATNATLTLANSGTTALTIGKIALTRGAQFKLVTGTGAGTCTVGKTLAAGRTCSLVVTFTPSGTTSFTDSLTVTASGTGASSSTATQVLTGN